MLCRLVGKSGCKAGDLPSGTPVLYDPEDNNNEVFILGSALDDGRRRLTSLRTGDSPGFLLFHSSIVFPLQPSFGASYFERV